MGRHAAQEPQVAERHVAAALDRETLAGELTGDLGALGDALAAVPARWRPDGAATATATLGGTFAAPQIERCSRLAPRRFQSRVLATRICTTPSVPL